MRLNIRTKLVAGFTGTIAVASAALLWAQNPLAAGGLVLLSVLLALELTHLIASPIHRLAKSAGDSPGRIDPGCYPDDESRAIATAIRNLAGHKTESIEAGRLALFDETVASVRHDINNPLMIIAGSAQILDAMMAESPQELKDRVSTILKETERIGLITKRLRDLKQPAGTVGETRTDVSFGE